jgi:hypothetical protein
MVCAIVSADILRTKLQRVQRKLKYIYKFLQNVFTKRFYKTFLQNVFTKRFYSELMP